MATMLRIHPISEQKASQVTQEIYHDIKNELGISAVPLVFQYLANYEAYLSYLWEGIKANIRSEEFKLAIEESTAFASQATGIIYTPSLVLKTFLQDVSEAEKHDLLQTVHSLEKLNTMLFLITLRIRESIKGLYTDKVQLSYQGESKDQLFNNIIKRDSYDTIDVTDTEAAAINTMLVPIFGSQSIAIIRYPEYFQFVASEMKALFELEAYLRTRVELEHIGLFFIDTFPYTLSTSYRDFMSLTSNREDAYDLLYLLKDVFPTQFPRLVLTSHVMKKTLTFDSGEKSIM